MSFYDVMRQALQPTALDLEPGFARAQFVQDLDRRGRVGRTTEAARLQQERQQFDLGLRERSIAHPFRSATKEERRYRPSGNANQYMLDAIQRDATLAEYDRQAPALRAERAALDAGRR